ncbi:MULTISPECIES: hypothetical protein [Thermoprotei]|uniref:hypothetical protein n=1 Tax=Thermoprotei TaxID=183924 RepID=UPI003168041D
MSLATVYGVPVYVAGDAQRVEVPFFKIRIGNEELATAYRYLAYKFGQYLFLKKGVVVAGYDPASGTLLLNGFMELDDVYSEYKNFVKEYLAPKLRKLIENADINDILPVFYYRRGEPDSSPTGLSTVVLAAHHVGNYIETLRSGYKIQTQEELQKKLSKMENELKQNQAGLKDIVLVNKEGDVRLLSDEEIAGELSNIDATVSGDVKEVEKDRCIYCGGVSKHLYPATGKLGTGRTRLSHETYTKISGDAQICLRCMLVTLFHRLNSKKDVLFELNGYLARFSDKLARRADTETLKAILMVFSKLENISRGEALVFNSLFGDERVRVKVEGLDEEAVERIALLYAVAGRKPFEDPQTQSLLVSYVFAPSLTESVRVLLHILKQFEKGGGLDMSYVSKYITSNLYMQEEDKRVAYALAKLAESVVYMIDEKSPVENKDYVKRRFADTLRRAGLSKAIAYAVSAGGIDIIQLPVPATGEERDHIKEVLEKYGFKYEQSNDIFKVDVKSIPLAEIRIEEEFTNKIYEDAYTYLVVLRPEIELG